MIKLGKVTKCRTALLCPGCRARIREWREKRKMRNRRRNIASRLNGKQQRAAFNRFRRRSRGADNWE